MEREQIVKALECCYIKHNCGGCPQMPCSLKKYTEVGEQALAIIKDLVEENDRLKELGTAKEVEKEIVRRQTKKEAVKEVKAAMWGIIRAEAVEVTNQNLDWLIERAVKVVERRDEG